ncbi:MAG: acyl-CoA desaturase [Gammaproteobacteria bacterium]|nr:MAG: acyl-CoA desaturase [Gammaproteobacteria bacterium]
MEYLYGILNLDFWGYVIAALIMFQVSIFAVTVYLHRDATHRALDLHPWLRHFFRLWIWMTSGMLTRQWVSVHRKHHARCETEEDPHSPQMVGLKKVLLEGAELYKVQASNPETLEKYGRGCPDDWVERNVYERVPYGGIIIMVLLDLLLFGVPGIIIIAFQMISMPLFAAGVINGIGHYYGYRNFECDDASTNITPLAIFVGGEELHNNHHAFPSSAKFSVRPWEFDIGWGFISIMKFLGLAKVRRVVPAPMFADDPVADLDALRAIIVNRMHVLRNYTKTVTLPVFHKELRGADADDGLLRRARKLLIRRPTLLDEKAHARLHEILENNHALKTVVEFRERLRDLWTGATDVSNEKLLTQLHNWIAEAEASGIRALQEFAEVLKSYRLQPAMAV